MKNANADAVFVYLNEEESARFLRAAKQAGHHKPMIGETTLIGAKVLELAGDAANGAKGHVGLTRPTRRSRRSQEFGKRFGEKYGFASDHNGVKGYMGAFMVKWATEQVGDLDSEKVADTCTAGAQGGRGPGHPDRHRSEQNGDSRPRELSSSKSRAASRSSTHPASQLIAAN